MNKIPVYTALTAEQALEWIKANSGRADEFLKTAQAAEMPLKDAAMTHILAAMAMCKASGWNIREFITLVELLAPPLAPGP